MGVSVQVCRPVFNELLITVERFGLSPLGTHVLLDSIGMKVVANINLRIAAVPDDV